jgi:CHAT domain-containing protein
VRSGARSALATLWTVHDEASALLIGSFYEELAGSGVSRAEALQRAQLRLLRTRHFQHPSYWSPFLLINSWL